MLFSLLRLAFLEIRAADDLERAQGLAHALHNVPRLMQRGASLDAIKAELRSQSEWRKVSGPVAAMFETARTHPMPRGS